MGDFKNLYRDNYFEHILNRKKDLKDLGYDYSNGKLLKKLISPHFYSSKKYITFLGYLDKMLYNMLESVKRIKKTFSYSVRPESNDIN